MKIVIELDKATNTAKVKIEAPGALSGEFTIVSIPKAIEELLALKELLPAQPKP